MTWIEVDCTLPTHPKTMEAAMLLDIPEAAVVGHMVCLWTWAVDAKPNGDLDLSKPRIIAKAARWAGEPGRFMDALLAVEFLDGDGHIHDWDEYTGRLMERRTRVRAQTRARVQKLRALRAELDPNKVARLAGNAVVTRYERYGNAVVTPSNAPTVPNRTRPNRTKPTPTTPKERVAPASTASAPDAPPAAPSTELVPVEEPRRRAPDPLWDAIRAIWPGNKLTDNERQRWNAACAQLRKAEYTAEEVTRAAAHWPNVMGAATMTPMALASNMSLLLDGPQVGGRSNGVTQEVRQRLTQSATLRPSAEDEAAQARALRGAPSDQGKDVHER